jgi:hypothetical protein
MIEKCDLSVIPRPRDFAWIVRRLDEFSFDTSWYVVDYDVAVFWFTTVRHEGYTQSVM